MSGPARDLPGYGYRPVLDAAAPLLRSEQVVVFSSHMSLAALYLAGLSRKRGVASPIAALGTTVTTGRQTGPDAVTVSSVRTRFDVAVLPESAAGRGIEVCRALFGGPIRANSAKPGGRTATSRLRSPG